MQHEPFSTSITVQTGTVMTQRIVTLSIMRGTAPANSPLHRTRGRS
jgi:hypothetical protein